MVAEIITIDPVHPDRAFSRCRDIVSGGGVIIYPTDTFYALGVDPDNAAAVRRLFKIKGREGVQPILLLIGDSRLVPDWAADVPPAAERLIKTHWPGPLTLVFKAKARVRSELTGSTGTIGLRVPGNDLVRQLLGSLGTALTGTSANRSGEPSPRTASEAAADLGDRVDLILDGGATPGGKPSTVVDISTGRMEIIREGAIKL